MLLKLLEKINENCQNDDGTDNDLEDMIIQKIKSKLDSIQTKIEYISNPEPFSKHQENEIIVKKSSQESSNENQKYDDFKHKLTHLSDIRNEDSRYQTNCTTSHPELDDSCLNLLTATKFN
jgi:hypothetical protein